MSKLPKPYVKAEKVGDDLLITIMGSGSRGHVLVGRTQLPLSDKAAITESIIEMIEVARGIRPKPEIQADGNS